MSNAVEVAVGFAVGFEVPACDVAKASDRQTDKERKPV